MAASESQGVAGETSIHRVTRRMDDFCIGQHQMDQPKMAIVARQLVGNIACVWREFPYLIKIFLSEFA